MIADLGPEGPKAHVSSTCGSRQGNVGCHWVLGIFPEFKKQLCYSDSDGPGFRAGNSRIRIL